MQYIIMFIIVVGLSLSDILTGWIKAHILNKYRSSIIRMGLYRKFAEWLIMGVAIGLEFGLSLLGSYYHAEEIAGFAGAFAAVSIFLYITVMETVSILENFGEITPNAAWIKPILKKLDKFSGKEDKDDSEKKE